MRATGICQNDTGMKLDLRLSRRRKSTVFPLLALLSIAASPMAAAQNLVITGVVDGPLSGGIPKAIELCVASDIADLSAYGVGSANNGGGSDGEEFTFPAGPVSAGTFIYVASESSGFTSFFGFAPTYTSGAASINGDDAIELFMSGGVVDVFGDINVDGTGQAWEHQDGWAYRNDGTGPDGSTFVLGNWSFSGPNALDGETSNATAATPFPIGAYSACALPVAVPDVVINEIDYDQPGADNAEFLELKNVGGVAADLSNFSVQLINGASGGASVYQSIALPPTTLAAGEYFVICADASATPNCDLDVISSIQNGSPDAVALWMNGAVVDAVSYEGSVVPPFVEGSGAGLEDVGGTAFSGISRFPDGIDTDLNNADLSRRCITPGAANSADFENCPDPLAGPAPPDDSGLVINEIHADPAGGLSGDANGDGTRHFGQDEFVEIVNNSGGPMDLSGWTLSDGAGVRHVFPAGSSVADQCAIVVFGGGEPSGGFGGAIVQTASTTVLGLNNSGDSITLNDGSGDVVMVAYGSEGGDNQSLTLDPDITGSPPYVKHTVATGSAGSLYSPGTRIDGSAFAGCDEPPPPPPPESFEIFEIQGSGLASPFEGQAVRTINNVVTAVGPNGFAMQTPTTRSDGDIDTSDGIYVFTGSAPTVAVGDVVDVTGTVVEFFDFTEFSGGPVVTVVGAGASLPAPVIFDVTTPSPDPASPSCAIEYECYEGMLVQMDNGTVTGPNQGFGSDPVAEFYITAGAERTFRGPGLEFPGMAGIPVWDGNPEVFELDADKLGLPNVLVTPGSTFSATGIIGYEFGGYELWASSLNVAGAPVAGAVRDAQATESTVGSLNLFRLFDDIDDPDGTNVFGEATGEAVVSSDEYQRRLSKLARFIVERMKSPDAIGVQEVESLKVLEDLAAAIDVASPGTGYQAFLVDGNDIGGIDVGFLVRTGSVRVSRVLQMGADETYVNPEDGVLDILHDRPPLVLQARFGPAYLPLNVMVVHNRSLGGIETERVQVKRFEQAQSIARMVDDLQGDRSLIAVVVIGDFNAFEFSDGFVDTVGHIRGVFDPADSLLSGADLVEPDLMNQVLALPENQRYSFIFRGNSQVLDHALTNLPLDLRVRGMQYARGNADSAADLINDGSTVLRASDHDGLVLYLNNEAPTKQRRSR